MIIWADGFDHYGTGAGGLDQMLDGAYADSSAGPSAAQARTGANSLPLSGTNAQTRRVFGSAFDVVGVAGAFYLDALPSLNEACALMSFRDAGNKPNLTIELQSTGIIAAWQGDHTVNYFTNLLGESTGALVSAASWNHIEVKATFGTSDGAVEVRLNGVTVLNLIGVNTCNLEFGVQSSSQVVFGWLQNNSGRTMYLDDLVAWDTSGSYNNDFIGDQKVFTDVPNDDTADVDWTPSSGAERFAMIDEIPADEDASYDEATINGDRMGVTFPDLDASVVSVSALLFYAKTRKTDAGVCNVQVDCQSGAAEDAGTDNPLTTAYTYRWDVFEVDPQTSVPWAPAAASAAAMVLVRTA